MVRIKNRYVICEIIFTEREEQNVKPITDKYVYFAVQHAVENAHGDYGMGCLHRSLYVKYFNPSTNIVYIRAGRSSHKMLLSALPFVTSIQKRKIFLRTLHVAGSMRSCSKFMIQHHKKELPKLLSQCETQEERQNVQAALIRSCTLFKRSFGIVDKYATDVKDG